MSVDMTVDNVPVLDPEDPIDKILIDMVRINRKKRADYARDTDPLSNFFETADLMRAKGHSGQDAITSVDSLITVKEIRLAALRANGRMNDAANESVRDTLLDHAVYSVLKLAIYDRMYPAGG